MAPLKNMHITIGPQNHDSNLDVIAFWGSSALFTSMGRWLFSLFRQTAAKGSLKRLTNTPHRFEYSSFVAVECRL